MFSFQSSLHGGKTTRKARLAQVLKTIFHQCVISYTCSQSNFVLNRAIRVRLATSISYDTLMKNCFKDWSQSVGRRMTKTNKMTRAPNDDSDQSGHTPRQTRDIAVRMNNIYSVALVFKLI